MAEDAGIAALLGDEEYEEDVGLEEEDADAAAAELEDKSPFDILYKFHPELIVDYAETVAPKIPLQVAPPTQEEDSVAVDGAHTSPPFLTRYEYTNILGARTNQLAQGARPFLNPVPDYITDPQEIARMELEKRLLPFIVKRPMPDGTFEYWRLSDLMIL